MSLRLSDSTVVAVPATLASITTYVVLEQEGWFEKEVAFLRRWLRPGMQVIDIGANLGVYSLPMAAWVGPAGRVFAYEPAGETRGFLERSRALNGAVNLAIRPEALSDRPRQAHLAHGASSELHSLGGDGAGEDVAVTTLDIEDGRGDWTSPDFIKIDAEGEEDRILVGGRRFFDRHSPLVMFEIKAGTVVNEGLRAAFSAMGYGIYRQLGGAAVLVPDDAGSPLDGYELNLFAAKPDRAARLAEDGVLVRSMPTWQPDDATRHAGLEVWRSQPFAAPFLDVLGFVLDGRHRDALAGYAVWRDGDRPLGERCAALTFACDTLRSLCREAPTCPRLSTLARVAWEAGRRAESVEALTRFIAQAKAGEIQVAEPFWPACPRYDDLSPTADPGGWFVAAAVEQLERSSGFSSLFTGGTPDLGWLVRTPFASTEMIRRAVLTLARRGQTTLVPDRLGTAAADHMNAAVWRDGLVPNTSVGN